MSSNLSLFSDDCERIGSFSSSSFLIQQVSSRVVSLLSWSADVGSLQHLPSSLTQELRQARVLLDSRSFLPNSPTEFVFGEFLSSRDIDRLEQSASSCSPCIGESRAFEVTRFSGLREAHEFSCPSGIPLPSSVVVSGRTVAPAGSSSPFLGSHDIPRSSFRRWCVCSSYV